jgi:hypothetical protein
VVQLEKITDNEKPVDSDYLHGIFAVHQGSP